MDEESGGVSLASIAAGLVHAIDDDVQEQAARKMFALPHEVEPSEEQIRKAAEPLKREAIHTLMSRPALRKLILDLRHKFEQVVDEVSKDNLIADQTGYSPEAREKAATLVHSFEQYLREHKDEVDALQFFYSVPHRKRLRYADIKALADAISAPPRQWTPEKLWRAYETLERSKVRGAGAGRLLTDVVSLVRFALHQEDELVPHIDRVQSRFQSWLAQQENAGRQFSEEQRRWLEMMTEQSRVVDAVERLLSFRDHTLDHLEHSTHRLARLRQSVLKCAFDGKLVDQDPVDEHADVLLARIRAERAVANPATSSAKRSKKLKAAS